MKKIPFLLVLFVSLAAFSQKSISFPAARFKTGDQPEWKNPGYDDSQWPSIKTGIRWEQQGYPHYDGFAWYRIKFILPSSLKQGAYWKDTLSFLMSRIDDADETFLNGVKIGKTGAFPTDAGGAVGMWDADRVYNVAANSDFINWDKENVIAVRVLDFSGGGGMFGDIPSVRMMMPQDVIDLTINAGTAAGWQASIKNTGKRAIEGIWTISVKDGAENKIVKSNAKPILLKGFEQLDETVTAPADKRMEIVASFKEKETGAKMEAVNVTPYILTPAPSKIPRINNASVFGVRPGSPFLFKIAATGGGTLLYKCTKLPEGLSLDKATGIITGKIMDKGIYKVQLSVSNEFGNTAHELVIKVGEQLALTPPMGWNSWNCWGLSVSDEKVRSSAQALIDKGLINHGWTFINIDDGWEKAERDNDGNIMSNEKFNDMPSLSSWLHGNGLKFGIYSSPGTTTCGGFLASYQHELKDASTWSQWGVDYLKYDWCSYGDVFSRAGDTSLAAYQKPYKVMQDALKQQPRDIVYSLCQYGMKDVWKWGADVNGNNWRTTGDITDTWKSVRSIWQDQAKLSPYANPGHWNDPDMLVVGQVGWSGKLRPSRLNPDEQYTHVSLWCLLSAPLLIGCDISKLDDFTLNLLSNDEVLAIDQDALGKQAKRVMKTQDYEIWVKELADGNKAIGLFNIGETYRKIPLNATVLGVKGNYKLRDLWRQVNMGALSDSFAGNVPPHGVVLLKLIKQ